MRRPLSPRLDGMRRFRWSTMLSQRPGEFMHQHVED